MDVEHALKEAKTLIVEKKSQEATEILTNALSFIQAQSDDELEQSVRLILESAIQENLGDAKIIEQKDQEALSHLIMAMTQLQTLETVSKQEAIDPLFRVYRKMSGIAKMLNP